MVLSRKMSSHKDLGVRPSTLGGDSKGLNGKESRVYPGSAPPMEVIAYVLLCVYLLDRSRLQGCRIANLAIERL